MLLILNNFLKVTTNSITHNWARNSSAVSAVAATSGSRPSRPTSDERAPREPERTSEDKQRSLHVAVIGVPNAGKSTFINNLINHRVCPTSSKVHTTRKANKAIYTTGHTQLVFYDTPGLVTPREIKKHNLEKSFRSAYRHAVQHADAIAVVHDVSNSWNRSELHATVIDTLKEYPALPSVLVLNKIDALKSKRILLDLIRTLTNDTLTAGKKRSKEKHLAQNKATEAETIAKAGEADTIGKASESETIARDGAPEEGKREVSWSNFTDVFLVSSISGNGLDDVHDYFVNSAKAAKWTFSGETFTDESPEALIVDSVRARLLDYLPQEIPYSLRSVIEYYSEENNTVFASVQVICPSVRIERLICGESNGKLRQITERVTSDLVETFGKPISLTISTQSAKKENK